MGLAVAWHRMKEKKRDEKDLQLRTTVNSSPNVTKGAARNGV